ncbi:DUF4244 domain-containing protein [Pseudarthrobacter sp. J64]|uniref:DUF4244 domain-containing protein n=1 Tax=Pseudarthrobacter sp. J64 TaxID=3116485 RepID=UPI002E8116AE|nr:DUF4244 domain-containing protein [Pseudarthrobacter sp. J64]MEE2567790.1 DUF4244 domain-containing protein [Pseudarthrobacter sp. J64]
MSAQLTALAGSTPAQVSASRPTAAVLNEPPAGSTEPDANERLADVVELYPGGASTTAAGSGIAGWGPLGRTGRRLEILWLKHRYFNRARLMGSEAGMATAEYAIATLAAVGFAGVLVFLLRSEEVRGFLLNLIRTALSLP